MDKANPFMNVDVTKIFGDIRLPEVEVESLLSSQRKNLEAAAAVGQLAFDGFQLLAKRQAELAKGCFESYTQGANAVIEAGTPEEKVAKQADLVETLFEETVSDFNELTDLTRKSANAIFHVIEKRFSESLGEFRTAVNGQVKSAPKAPTAKPASKAPAKA
ncbi:MAG: phasin family protein [Alphaproteobacteria bacterium]|nr:phasin family protein [Alphaproteobacteria bacterium]